MLEGEISQINLVERLVELWREQFTGAIRFENDGIIKIVYFKSGDILSASTNDRSDSIDEILMRAGKVSREHVKQALAKRKENETLGDALLNLGFITRKELTWARRVQAVGVIRSIAAWTEGSFTIVEDYLPKRDEGTLFSLPQVLVELIVTEQDRARFERALDGGQAVFAKTPDFREVWGHLGLNEDAERIVDQIDGEKTASEIATASESDSFNVYKLLHALALLGVLKRSGKPQVTPQLTLDDEFTAAGVADAADLWGDPQPDLSGPAFELDDVTPYTPPAGPEIEIPAPAPELPQEAVSEPAELTWDDEPLPVEEPDATPEPAPTHVPAWEAPPREVLAVPIPAAIEPPAEAEEQWGFDEAQLETARRASLRTEQRPAEPVRKPSTGAFMQPRPRRRSALPVVLLLLVVVAAGGWYGFSWWQTQQARGETGPLVERPSDRAAAQAPAATDSTATTTIAESTATAAPAVLTTSTTTTTTMAVPSAAATASVPQPATSTAAPTATAEPLAPVVPQSATEALAPVVPRSTDPGRQRYDAMAQQFAANPQGNYTIQIQILCQASNLGQAMKAGGSQVWFVPQTISGRSCYRVFWGHFNTRDEAQRAMASVPASLRDRSAAVKAVPKRQ